MGAAAQGVAVALLGFAHFESTAGRTLCWGLNGLSQSCCYALCIRALAPFVDPATRASTMGLWTTSQVPRLQLQYSCRCKLLWSCPGQPC